MGFVGEKRKAKDVHFRLAWFKYQDIKWALEVCSPGHRQRGFCPSKTTGVLFVGGHHENDPKEVWATTNRPANNLETEYTCIFTDER